MKRPQFHSLWAKVLFYSFLPFTLVLIIIVIVGIQVFERVSQRVARQRETELARVVAGQVERRLAEASARLLDAGPELLGPQMETASRQIGLFDGGYAVYSPSGELLRAEPAAPGWEGLISRELETIVLQRRVVYSNIFRAPLSAQPAIMIAVPILAEQGRVKAIVAAVASLTASPLIEDFAALLEFQRDRSGHAYLVDGRWKFIYHGDRSLRGTALAETVLLMRATYGLNGAVVTRDVSGERVMAGYAPVAGSRWALVTRERWQVIVGPVRLYSLVLLAVLVVGGAASTLLVLFAVGRILKPIRELTVGAKRIANGQFEHRIKAVTGDEIEDLARQFNAMADSLKGLYRGLKQKVELRTQEVLQQQRKLAVIEERSRVAPQVKNAIFGHFPLLPVNTCSASWI